MTRRRPRHLSLITDKDMKAAEIIRQKVADALQSPHFDDFQLEPVEPEPLPPLSSDDKAAPPEGV